VAHQNWIPAPGQIIRAEVPFSDTEGTKSRFPVVVSSEDFNSKHPEVIVAYCTRSSNVKSPRDYDVEISDRRTDFALTGLRESTIVRCGRLFTLDKRSISDVLGSVPEDVWVDVHHLVLACF
jgi:mRNA-degrading endonuclease toxin of MazEF toxin-antitoxin module